MFSVVTEKRVVHISPFYLRDIEAGIRRELNDKLLKYESKLNGVILCYRNLIIKMEDANSSTMIGDIKFNNPLIFIPIEVDWIVMRLVLNELYVVTVVSVGQYYMICKLNGLFNVKVLWKNERKSDYQAIEIGSTLKLRITSIAPKLSKNQMNIIGCIADIDEDSHQFIDKEITKDDDEEMCEVMKNTNNSMFEEIKVKNENENDIEFVEKELSIDRNHNKIKKEEKTKSLPNESKSESKKKAKKTRKEKHSSSSRKRKKIKEESVVFPSPHRKKHKKSKSKHSK